MLPVFFAFLFGIIQFGLILWTQSGLYYAAEAAARCASVDTTDCASSTTITSYALNHYHGQPLGGTNPFSYNYNSASSCGHTVSASYSYSLMIPFGGTYTVPLTATACFP